MFAAQIYFKMSSAESFTGSSALIHFNRFITHTIVVFVQKQKKQTKNKNKKKKHDVMT